MLACAGQEHGGASEGDQSPSGGAASGGGAAGAPEEAPSEPAAEGEPGAEGQSAALLPPQSVSLSARRHRRGGLAMSSGSRVSISSVCVCGGALWRWKLPLWILGSRGY